MNEAEYDDICHSFIERAHFERRKAILTRDFDLPAGSHHSEVITLACYLLDLMASVHLLTVAVSMHPEGRSNNSHHYRVLSCLIILALTTTVSITRHILNKRWYSTLVALLRFGGLIALCSANSLDIVDPNKANRIAAFVGAIVLLLSSVFKAIILKSFCGPFGPLWPSVTAPTIIPYFAIAIISTAQLVVTEGLKLAEGGERLFVNQIIIVQISTFSFQTLGALATLNIAFVGIRLSHARKYARASISKFDSAI